MHKDRNYDHVSKNLVDKIPRYQSTASVGSEPGMEENIILSRNTGKLCYHDGQYWNCIPTSTSCVNAIYQGTTGVIENTYVNITNGTDDTVGFIGPADATRGLALRQGVTPGRYYKTNSAGQLEETTCCQDADFAGVSDNQIVPV